MYISYLFDRYHVKDFVVVYSDNPFELYNLVMNMSTRSYDMFFDVRYEVWMNFKANFVSQFYICIKKQGEKLRKCEI